MLRPYEDDYAVQQARRLGKDGINAIVDFIKQRGTNLEESEAIQLLLNSESEA